MLARAQLLPGAPSHRLGFRMDLPSTDQRDPRSNLDAARDAASRGDYQVAAALYSRLIGNPDHGGKQMIDMF